ncbi:MAG: outer membrane protein transport protein [Magnetococcales bacterium]|nr:outer membrane protein transport protein [Magnetococcales bacterium]
MKVQKIGFLSLLTITVLSVAPAYASNGYFSHGFGTANKGMAGAGVAVPTDTMATAINPALMAHMGNRMDMGVALFSPVRGFTADTPSSLLAPFIPPGTYEKDDDFFLIPHFGWNKMLDSTSSLGVSIGGNGGMNTKYDIPVFGNFAPPGMTTTPTGIDLSQMFIGITYANRITPEHTLGIAPILAGQRFKATGLQPFMGVSSHPESVTNNNYSYSYGGGLKLGWYWTPNDLLAVGASYQSRLYMTPFEKYKGLFADEGDFDIPPVIQVGFAIKPTPAWTVAFDVQKLMFGDIKSVANSNDVPMAPGALGPENGLGFGWKDMTVYKLGLQWQASDEWTLRTGYSVANQVIPSRQALFNILAPATVTQHITFGASWTVDTHNSVNMAFGHAFDKRVYGVNPNTPFQTGSLAMYQNEFEISWSHRF